jgi:hypothetical protein
MWVYSSDRQGEKYQRNEYQSVDNRSSDGLTRPGTTAEKLEPSDNHNQ